jgi:hypothetical protein
LPAIQHSARRRAVKISLAANHGMSLDLNLGVRNRERSDADEGTAWEVITKHLANGFA